MHKDAEFNYSHKIGPLSQPPNQHISGMSDKEVVLYLWGDERYMWVTGDSQHQFSKGLRDARRRTLEAGNLRGTEAASAYSQLRRDFEENGWYGSPVGEPFGAD